MKAVRYCIDFFMRRDRNAFPVSTPPRGAGHMSIMRKKITLVAINARYTHSCLALYCLKSHVRGLGHDVSLREYSLRRDTDEIAEETAGGKPDVVGLSVYIWNATIIERLVPLLRRRLPGALIVLGGPEAGYDPDRWLRGVPGVDCVVRGPGEQGFAHILAHGPGAAIIDVPNPPFPELPFPYEESDFPGLANRYVYYESSRGCPFRCTYCISSRGDQALEFRPPELVRKELAVILSRNPMMVKFVDRTFNASGSYSRGIWSFLLDIRGDSPTRFHFEIHPALLEEEDFEILSRCPPGLFHFEIGVQTINPRAREAIRRGGEWTRERQQIERLVHGGRVRVHLDLIAGLPWDDLAWARRSFNELYALGSRHLQLGFLKVLPGTEMAASAPDHDIAWDPSPPYRVRETAWLTAEDLDRLDRVAHLVDRLHNTGRFPETLTALEALFESPFDLYDGLGNFMKERGSPPGRGRESGSAFLGEFIGRLQERDAGPVKTALDRDMRAMTAPRETRITPAARKRGRA